MCKQNVEQTLIHKCTKVTLGEHETKSLHLCKKTWHTTQVYTSKIYWEQKNSSIVVCFFWRNTSFELFSSLSLLICFAFYQYSPCHCNFNFWRIDVVRYWEVKLHWIKQFGPKMLSGIRYSGCFITLKIEGNNRDRRNRPVSWGFRYWEDPV